MDTLLDVFSTRWLEEHYFLALLKAFCVLNDSLVSVMIKHNSLVATLQVDTQVVRLYKEQK